MKNTENYELLKNKLKGIRGFQMISVVCLSLYTLCLYGLILLLQTLVDTLTSSNNATFEVSSLSFVFVLLVLLAISGFISQYFFNQLPIKAKNVFLGKLYKDVLKKHVCFIDDKNRGEIYSLLTNDAISFAQLVALNPVVFGYQFVTFVLCVTFMVFNQWKLALLLIGFVILCFLFTSLLSKNIAGSNQKVFKEKETMTKQMLEGLQNHKVLRILNKQSLFSHKFENFLNKDLQPVEIKAAFYQSQYMTIYILLTIVLPFLSVAIGIYFVSVGWMSIGQILAMYALASQLQEPIRQIADIRTNRFTAIQLAERLSVLLFKKDKEKKELKELKDIHINNITFAYDQTLIIQNLSMELHKNDHILIKGESGCGKSTLLSLLMRFQEVQSGTITINGLNINEYNLESYYQHVLMVDQKSFLFHDSLKNNITLYDEYSNEELVEVLNTCQLSSFYEENKDIIIDGGSVSGGQAQRICIARMLLRKPDVLLLDEVTSALDYQTGVAFTKALNEYCQNYHITLLIVSHKKDITTICEKSLLMS